jgi:hypothetical protein
MTMLNDVADVETVARLAARPPGTRAAIAYLTATFSDAPNMTGSPGDAADAKTIPSWTQTATQTVIRDPRHLRLTVSNCESQA